MDCLEDLLKFKCFGETANPKEHYVENFVDINTTELANLADEFTLTGKKLGENILINAVNNLRADIVLSKGNVSMNNTGEQLKNTWLFGTGFSAQNGGVTLLNISHSKFAKILITKIEFIPNFSGAFDILLDDGRTPQVKTVTAVAGSINTYELEYETNMSSVKISTVDDSLSFGNLTKANTGCSSCQGKKFNIIDSGLLSGVNSLNAFKFIPTAYLSCDNSDFICIASKNENLKFAICRLLAYQIGIIFYRKMLTSKRYNETTLGLTKENIIEFIDELEGKYILALNGSKSQSGISTVIQSHINQSNDWCVKCTSQFSITKAVF